MSSSGDGGGLPVRLAPWGIAVLVGVLVALGWNWRLSHVPSPQLTMDPLTRGTLDVVHRPLPPIDVDGSFVDAAEALRRAAAELNVRLEVETERLGLRGHVHGASGHPVSANEQSVRLRMRSATLGEAVQALADQHVHRGALSWWVESEGAAEPRIVLTGRSHASPPLVMRVYDVTDLIEEAERYSSRFADERESAVPRQWRGLRRAQERGMALGTFMESFVEPGTWERMRVWSAPAYGSWDSDGRWLTVRQTPAGQRQVELLLAALRAGSHDLEQTPWQERDDD